MFTLTPIVKNTGHSILGLIEPGCANCLSANDAVVVYQIIKEAMSSPVQTGSNHKDLARQTTVKLCAFVKDRLNYDVPARASNRARTILVNALANRPKHSVPPATPEPPPAHTTEATPALPVPQARKGRSR